ncbi:hypothetical protein BGZ63DRAFT_373215 [Mariannaea sp. PMI_226]|nr:hypothetical protein BGZ63DRAFT_373215 [Mariannaea sp. PMI_226]
MQMFLNRPVENTTAITLLLVFFGTLARHIEPHVCCVEDASTPNRETDRPQNRLADPDVHWRPLLGEARMQLCH